MAEQEPASLEDLTYARRGDTRLRRRVESAVILAAYEVVIEAANTANHAERLAWAHEVSTDPAVLSRSVDRVLIRCIQNPTIRPNPDLATDNDIRFVANGAVDALAGVVGVI